MYFILSILLSSRYVKVYLLPDRSKSGKRKTKVKKHTINPVFDEVLKVCDLVTPILPYTCFIPRWWNSGGHLWSVGRPLGGWGGDLPHRIWNSSHSGEECLGTSQNWWLERFTCICCIYHFACCRCPQNYGRCFSVPFSQFQEESTIGRANMSNWTPLDISG